MATQLGGLSSSTQFQTVSYIYINYAMATQLGGLSCSTQFQTVIYIYIYI
jgi:hypothetical protein